MRKMFEHLGYYSDLNDILRLYDKMAGDCQGKDPC